MNALVASEVEKWQNGRVGIVGWQNVKEWCECPVRVNVWGAGICFHT